MLRLGLAPYGLCRTTPVSHSAICESGGGHSHLDAPSHSHHHPHPHGEPHGHSGHSHGLVDPSIVRSRDGVKTVSISLIVLTIAALAQTVVFLSSGSVAL